MLRGQLPLALNVHQAGCLGRVCGPQEEFLHLCWVPYYEARTDLGVRMTLLVITICNLLRHTALSVQAPMVSTPELSQEASTQVSAAL